MSVNEQYHIHTPVCGISNRLPGEGIKERLPGETVGPRVSCSIDADRDGECDKGKDRVFHRSSRLTSWLLLLQHGTLLY